MERIVVAGAGSIGCFVGGLLAAAGRRVSFLARPRMVEELAASGLTLTDCDGGRYCLPPERVAARTDLSLLAEADVILVTVKSGGTEEIGRSIAAHAPDGVVVVSLQNGIGNADRLTALCPRKRVVAGMVPFNVVHEGQGSFHRGTTGGLVVAVGAPGLARLLRVQGLAVAEHGDMPALAWGKLLMNLNNALNALSGLPLAEQLSDRRWRRVLAASQEEALTALRKAGIQPARVGRIRPRLLPAILRLPDPVFRMLAGTMLRIDPRARSSMWEDLARGRPTEVEHLQGAVIALAHANGLDVPVNERVSAAIRRAEAQGPHAPTLPPEALLAQADRC